MDDEIMEALYENPFQQHEEKLEESHQDAQGTWQQDQDLCIVENEGILHLDSQHELHDIDQQVEVFHMAENEEIRSFISDLVEINEDTQENDVPILEK